MQIDRDIQLTPTILANILQANLSEVAKLKRLEKYYLGDHAILHRQMNDTTVPNNKVVVNYAKLICDSYTSYLVGTPITYNTDDIIKTTLKYNDIADLDTQTALDCNIFGYGVNMFYIDNSKQVRLTRINPIYCLLLYSNDADNELLYAIRWYPVNDFTTDSDKFVVEVWDNSQCQTYETNASFSGLKFIDATEHYFKDVPFVEFLNNDYRKSSFEDVCGLIDGLEKLDSDAVNNFESFVDAYLVFKGVTADAEDIQKMKENRVLLLDNDNDASYLIKDVNMAQIESLRNDFVKNIHKISCVPDMSDENFANNSSGVAIRYKLLAYENATVIKERKFKRGLQRRIELIGNILSLYDNVSTDADFIFTRNLPVNDSELATMVGQLNGIVSQETLLSQLPFVTDTQQEIKQLKADKEANMSLYQLNHEGGVDG